MNEETPLRHRAIRIGVSARLLEKNFDHLLMMFAKAIPVKAEYIPWNDTIEYVLVSPDFPACEPGGLIDFWEARFLRTDDKTHFAGFFPPEKH